MITTREQLIEQIKQLALAAQAINERPVAVILNATAGSMLMRHDTILAATCAEFARASMQFIEDKKAQDN